jgi:hypothetical protein
LTVNPPLSKEEIKLPEHGIVSLPRFYCHHGLYVVYFAIFYFVVSIYICCWLGVAVDINCTTHVIFCLALVQDKKCTSTR